jgi:hypothetical protein
MPIRGSSGVLRQDSIHDCGSSATGILQHHAGHTRQLLGFLPRDFVVVLVLYAVKSQKGQAQWHVNVVHAAEPLVGQSAILAHTLVQRIALQLV